MIVLLTGNCIQVSLPDLQGRDGTWKPWGCISTASPLKEMFVKAIPLIFLPPACRTFAPAWSCSLPQMLHLVLELSCHYYSLDLRNKAADFITPPVMECRAIFLGSSGDLEF